nr:hypothetical protein Q903MT_gene2186 [Picea sitchensis]
MKFKLYREIHELRILTRQRDTQMHGSVPLVATMGDTKAGLLLSFPII